MDCYSTSTTSGSTTNETQHCDYSSSTPLQLQMVPNVKDVYEIYLFDFAIVVFIAVVIKKMMI